MRRCRKREAGIHRSHNLALWNLLFGVDDIEFLFPFRKAVIRYESNAKANPGQVNQQIIAAQLYFRNQFQLLLQYIRIMYETGMVHQMHRFDLFDVDAYEDVLTGIAGDLAETVINILDRAAEAECSMTDSFS